MTLRKRVAFSFLAILLLFGINLGIYFWGSAKKRESLNEVQRAVAARLLESSVERDLEERNKEIDVLAELGSAIAGSGMPEENAENAENAAAIEQRLERLSGKIDQLITLSAPAAEPFVREFSATFRDVKASWLSRLRTPGTPVVAGNDRIPVSADRALVQIRALQDVEQKNVDLANDTFNRVSRFTDRVSVGIFIASMLVAVGVAAGLSRHLHRGLTVLKEGARQVGAGQLEHRIALRSKDELSDLGHAFNNMTERLQVAQARLRETNDELERQLAEAAEYVRSLLPLPMRGAVSADWRFVPSMQLGGDAFGYHWLDDRRVAMYLLDVCGHGVGAALLSISVINMLRSRSLPDTQFDNPADVLRRLNDAFPMEQQNDMYFTMWYGVYDNVTRQLTYSTAGHPPAILLSQNGHQNGHRSASKLRQKGLSIGSFPGARYVSEARRIEGPARLYIFSDGIYEIGRTDGTMMQFDEFVELLASSPEEERLDHVLTAVRRLRGPNGFDDDVSVVEVAFA